MSHFLKTLESLREHCYVTGNEITYSHKEIPAIFAKHHAEIDDFGNLSIIKKSKNPNAKNILIEAHLDEIGFCIKEITKNGFLAVSPCGGFDSNIIPGTEFFVHSKEKYKAIAGSIPPHLLKKEENGKKNSFDNIYLDCGFSSKEEAEKSVSLGDPITFASPVLKLLNGKFCCPSLDNKAAVIALLETCEKVQTNNHLHFLFTVGEESTSRGVKCANFNEKFDFALVVDAGFAKTKGLNEDQCILMDHGPSVSIADTLTRDVAFWISGVAKDKKMDLQIVVEPGGTGTSATALQLRNHGIPCALISIPIKNMHTASEIVSEKDIEKTVNLLCCLLEHTDIKFGEVNIIESK